jgi:hypothetical protein
MKLIKTIALTLSLSTPMLASAIESLPFSASITGENLYVTTAGEVVLTFLSKSADLSSELFLEGTSASILNNQTAVAGTQYSLGNFEAGQLLSFSLLVNNTNTYFTGAASRNTDNVIHAAYSSVIGNTINIGFEDLLNGGDLDYNDLVFSVTNVYAAQTPVSPVSEPETYAMFMAGLGLMGWASKRRQQK